MFSCVCLKTKKIHKCLPAYSDYHLQKMFYVHFWVDQLHYLRAVEVDDTHYISVYDTVNYAYGRISQQFTRSGEPKKDHFGFLRIKSLLRNKRKHRSVVDMYNKLVHHFSFPSMGSIKTPYLRVQGLELLVACFTNCEKSNRTLLHDTFQKYLNGDLSCIQRVCVTRNNKTGRQKICDSSAPASFVSMPEIKQTGMAVDANPEKTDADAASVEPNTTTPSLNQAERSLVFAKEVISMYDSLDPKWKQNASALASAKQLLAGAVDAFNGQ